MKRWHLAVGALALLVVAVGCDRKTSGSSASSSNGTTAHRHQAAAEAGPPVDVAVGSFLFDLVRRHGLAAHQDRGWVVFEPSGVALGASDHPTEPGDGGGKMVIVQLDFRTRLPGGQEVVQEVVGWGDDRDAAVKSAEVSFTLGTFHALLGAFVDPDEQHVVSERRTIGGRPRVVTYGDILTKTLGGDDAGGKAPTSRPAADENEAWHRPFLAALDASALPPGLHTVDLYNGMIGDKQEMEIQLDHRRWAEMEATMRNAPWPRHGGFTSVRQFVVIQDVGEGTRARAGAKINGASTRPG
jgi:hypothetical protein